MNSSPNIPPIQLIMTRKIDPCDIQYANCTYCLACSYYAKPPLFMTYRQVIYRKYQYSEYFNLCGRCAASMRDCDLEA